MSVSAKGTSLLGSLLIIVAGILFASAFYLTSTAGELAMAATKACRQKDSGRCIPGYIADAVAPAGKSASIAGTAGAADQSEQHQASPLQTSALDLVLSGNRSITLRLPLLCFVASLLLLGSGVGLILQGDAFGMLLDTSSGCASLSRVQASLRTVLILAG